MHDRRIRNFQQMSTIWTAKVREAKQELDQQLSRGRAVHPRSRARFRQYGLCLAVAQEQIELLTGAPNPTRERAFEEYSSMVRQLKKLQAETEERDLFTDVALEPMPDGDAPEPRREARIEAAERAADVALLQWCTA